MEPKAKIKSGLLAVALGMTATLSGFSLGAGTAMAQLAPGSPATAHVQPTTAADATLLRATADTELTRARSALAHKDVATAERVVAAVEGQRIPFEAGDDKPEHVRALLRMQRKVADIRRQSGETQEYRRQNALYLLEQADGFYRKGLYDPAEKLVQEAGAQGALFNETDKSRGREPATMLKAIQTARLAKSAAARPAAQDMTASQNAQLAAAREQLSVAAQKDLANSQGLLRQARQLLNTGNPASLDAAERFVRSAVLPNISESLYPPGSDVPSRMLAEIAARRMGQPVAQNPAGHPSPQATSAVYNPGLDRTQLVQTGSQAQEPSAFVPGVPGGQQYVQFAEPTGPTTGPTLAPGLQPTAPLRVPQSDPVSATQYPQPVFQQPMLVDQAAQQQRLMVQQLANSIIQQISDADRATRRNDPQTALKILDQARIRVDEAPLDPQTKAGLMRSIETATANTESFINRNESLLEQDRINNEVRQSRQAEMQEKIDMEKQIKTYVEETNRLIKENKFEDAMRVAQKAKQFAPDDPTVNILETTTRYLARTREYDAIKAAKEDGFVRSMLAVDRASIPDDTDYRLRPDWEVFKKQRRGFDDILSNRPEAEREIIRKLALPVKLDLNRPMPLTEMVNYLMAQTNVQMMIDYQALREVDVLADETQIAISLPNEITLKSALNLILQQVGLSYVIENEVLKITSARAARGKTYQVVYYVGDLVHRAPNFDGTNPHGLRESIDAGHRSASNALHRANAAHRGGASSYYAADSWQQPASYAGAGPMSDHINAQFNIPLSSGGGGGLSGGGSGFSQPGFGPGAAAGGGGEPDFEQLIEIITTVVAPDSWEEGADLMEYYGNMSLIIRQTEEIHQEIVELLQQLRKLNDLQVTVEVRFITLSDSFYERMGVDFQMSINNSSGADRMTYNTDLFSNTSNNSNTSNTSSNNNNNNNNNNSTGSQYLYKGSSNVAGLTAPGIGSYTPDFNIPIQQGSYGLATPMFGPVFSPSDGLTMGFAILSDIEAYFFLNAAEADVRSNVLQAPKITIFNGQMASIMDASQTPFVTSVIPVVGDFAAAYQPVIVVLNEGQAMTVQGVVSNNRQNVRVTVNPTFSKINKVETFKFVGKSEYSEETTQSKYGSADITASTDEKKDTASVKSVSDGVTVQLPIITTLQVSTTVSVPDGGTVLLGGIKRLSEGRKEHGTPILNKIPYINRLFMNTAIGRDTSSIMMMVTPRIIIQEEEEEALTGAKTGL